MMATTKDLAELIFPNIHETVEDIEKKYPARQLPEGAYVTRFAPSPTGFLHTGSLFTAMIGYKLAKQSHGVFYIRLEDTDTKREIEGSGLQLLSQLKAFGIVPDEGYYGDHEEGNYGPYAQSNRAYIYKVYIKDLISKGRAYPCFCTAKDLDDLRTMQEKNKWIPGYYQHFAKCRFLTVDEAIEKIQNGEHYVIRFKSMGNHLRKIKVHDLIRGTLEIAENDQDIVILKSDGLPTYHFAHAIDDHLMHTTTVTRGEEWISSLPIHVELFSALGFKCPDYAHLPVIMKMDQGCRRKLSKRKDDEAAVSFFLADGYPADALLEYLMTIANSNFEEWRGKNPNASLDDFRLTFEKIAFDGALFDMMKLKFIAKERLSKRTALQITKEARAWAEKYNPALAQVIDRDPAYFERIMNIEREKENPRKDYEKYSDLLTMNRFFYSDFYDSMLKEKELPWNPFFEPEMRNALLSEFAKTYQKDLNETDWFASLKVLGEKYHFAPSAKIYKQDKEHYVGHIGDVAEMVRIAMTTSKQSPNLYWILQILGPEEIARRIECVIHR